MLRWLRRKWHAFCVRAIAVDGWWKFGFQGVAYVVIPGLLEERFGLGPWIAAKLPEPAEWMTPYVLLGLLFVWVTAFQLLYSKMKEEPHRHQLNKEDLQILHELIRQVVRQKAQRFGRFIQDNIDCFVGDPSDCFEGNGLREITKPEDQLFLHAHAIGETFVLVARRRAGRDVPIRCRIASFDSNGLPTKWVAWAGAQPSTPIAQLAEGSALSSSFKRRSMVVIEDIDRELKKKNPLFQRTSAGNNEIGSLICFPIVYGYTDSVPYVISIASTEPGVFRDEDVSLYTWVLEDFQDRLVLEHSLFLIREVTT